MYQPRIRKRYSQGAGPMRGFTIRVSKDMDQRLKAVALDFQTAKYRLVSDTVSPMIDWLHFEQQNELVIGVFRAKHNITNRDDTLRTILEDWLRAHTLEQNNAEATNAADTPNKAK